MFFFCSHCLTNAPISPQTTHHSCCAASDLPLLPISRPATNFDCISFGAPTATSQFLTSFIVSAICAVIGPINAELNLDCNTAHGAAWVLFPVLLASHALAM